VAGIAALAVDEGAYHGDPFAIQLWPVHPLWIVVPTGIGLTIALVLAVCAILLKRGKTPAVVAVAIGALPEVLIVLTLVAVVGNELT
jgi:hypothetical protein